MKKRLVKNILTMLVMIAMVINLAGTVNAASSLDARLSATSTELEVGKEIAVTISLANINVGEGVNTFQGTVEWDKEVLEFVDYEKTLNDWSTTWNPTDGTLVSVHLSGLVKTDTGVAKLIFKVKDVEELEDTTITVKNMESANTQEKVTPSSVSLTLTVPEVSEEETDGNTVGNTTTENNTIGNTTENTVTENNTNNVTPSGTVNNQSTTKDTTANKKIPYAGMTNTIIVTSITVLFGLGIISFVQYKKYKGI